MILALRGFRHWSAPLDHEHDSGGRPGCCQFPEICRTKYTTAPWMLSTPTFLSRDGIVLVMPWADLVASVSGGLMAHENAMSRYQITKSPTNPQRFSSAVPRISLSSSQSPNTRLAWPCASLLLGFENPTNSCLKMPPPSRLPLPDAAWLP